MSARSWQCVVGMGAIMATLMGGALVAPTSGASGAVSRPRVSAPASQHGRASTAAADTTGIVPPANPSKSLPPSPNFTGDGNCSFGALDDSTTCNTDVIQSIDNARSTLESLQALSVKLSAFEAMTVPQQIFVITNLERTDRGLTPITGLTTQLDGVAQTGASNSTDPTMSSSTLTGGATVTSWGSLWAGETSNPLGSDYYWMYDDGPGSPNTSCTTPSSSACWGHRDQILGSFAPGGCSSGSEQYMGAATASGGSSGPSFTEILVGACGPTPTDVVFTWAQAEQELGAGGGGGATAPGAPGDVTAVTSKRKGVMLSWEAPADNGGAAITGYRIFRARSSGAETLYRSVACTSSTCSYANRQARPKAMFFYTVAAVNAVGTGSPSTEVSAQSR